jgi:uncharacterized protein YxjI
MQTYELTQKILSIGPTYEVRNVAPQLGVADDNAPPVVTIKGKLLSATPMLSMNEGAGEGPAVGSMKGNFTRTKFECKTADDRLVGSIQFPMIALKKSFTLLTEGKEYKADGGYLAGEFVCKDDAGNVVMKITKQLSLRDKFRIEADDSIPSQLALLAAVAVDQRFFQDS